MEFELNFSPHLTMAEITSKLFNQKFLSDVQFLVNDKVIYAHTLELMKRSVVFQSQLIATLGDTKLIPINDIGYDSVFQFVRFIYCDECDICDENAIDLLKLATRYKVIKLQNKVIDTIRGVNMRLKIFEYCLLENDQFCMRRFRIFIYENLKEDLESVQFLTVHPVVIEEILKFEHVNISEYELFKSLGRWINRNAKDNHIDRAQHSTHYAKLIRLIRFPVMTTEEIIRCTTDFPQLFTESDYGQLFKTIAKSPEQPKSQWNATKRIPFKYLNEWRSYFPNEKFETKFTVSCEMLLCGLRFGSECNKGDYEITFTQRDCDTNQMDQLAYKCVDAPKGNSNLINLGESIRIQPNKEFTIEFKYFTASYMVFLNKTNVLSRKETTAFHTNVSPELISIKKCSPNLHELFFKLIT